MHELIEPDEIGVDELRGCSEFAFEMQQRYWIGVSQHLEGDMRISRMIERFEHVAVPTGADLADNREA